MAQRVLLTHPNRQYSHQNAVGLQRADMLGAYWTGVPARPVLEGTPFRSLGRLLERHSLVEQVPPGKVAHCFWGPLSRRASLLLPRGWAVDVQHRGMAAFDRWCARRVGNTSARVVAAAENAALETFRAARMQEKLCVLEAASFHHAWQDEFYDYPEPSAVHARINERKDQEIALADRIHTVSGLARESYLDAGIAPEKVVSVTIGCDLSQFHPRTGEKQRQHAAPFTFIFAGHAGRRKGADTLLDACDLLDRRGLPYRVWVAGASEGDLPWSRSGAVERLGWIPHETLTERYRRADCMVLPSRHDSFGMVVVEAMACGTPAIVSDQTGAREAITLEKSGWVLPADDADGLAAHMQWCIEHASILEAMRPEARRDAGAYGWAGYYGRVVEAYTSLLDGEPALQNETAS